MGLCPRRPSTTHMGQHADHTERLAMASPSSRPGQSTPTPSRPFARPPGPGAESCVLACALKIKQLLAPATRAAAVAVCACSMLG